MTEQSTKIYLWPSSVLNTFVKGTPDVQFHGQSFFNSIDFIHEFHKQIIIVFIQES